MSMDRDEYVRLRAYALWAQEGQPEGREGEHWARASAEFDERPRTWILTPIAEPDDQNWLGGPIWQKVTVNARTSGEARLLALRWEAERLGHDAEEGAAGNAAMSYQSALADPALYVLEESAEPASGKLGVVGEPVQHPAFKSQPKTTRRGRSVKPAKPA